MQIYGVEFRCLECPDSRYTELGKDTEAWLETQKIIFVVQKALFSSTKQTMCMWSNICWHSRFQNFKGTTQKGSEKQISIVFLHDQTFASV